MGGAYCYRSVKWLNYYAGMKIDRRCRLPPPRKSKPDGSRCRTEREDNIDKLKTFPWQLIGPYGIAFDSKGLVYVADQKVGAVFIFNLRCTTLLSSRTAAMPTLF